MNRYHRYVIIASDRGHEKFYSSWKLSSSFVKTLRNAELFASKYNATQTMKWLRFDHPKTKFSVRKVELRLAK